MLARLHNLSKLLRQKKELLLRYKKLFLEAKQSKMISSLESWD
jgi:hypothetical protein